MLDLPAVEIAGKLAGPVFLGAGHKHLAKRLVGAADQRYQAGPTPGVEFAHHIVDQQDRRRAVDAGMEEAKSSVSDVKNAAADELSSGSDADKSNTKASGQGSSV